ncbi:MULTISPECIES: HNH endonuclease signature motif containing protein [unclassified Brevibacterium]|uniref:HNH endonuclease signature motif containing protein n=1 Tax=unclassified Brevibacterium TaxID=2614124 RepID=UPI00109186F8|nr:HNH endonuclease signature motif containing protein [Brevibacterium sp. S22]TGD31029.1 HNH endonuclease [Brevibacterium sp. S22]
MKGTTDRSTPAHAEEDETTPSSPRLTIRFESNMSRFAVESAAADRAHISTFESLSAVVLEQVFINLDFPIPEGPEPYRCETIAGTFERREKESAYAAEAEAQAVSESQAVGKKSAAEPSESALDAPSSAGVPSSAGISANAAVFYDEDFAREQKKKAEEGARNLLPEFPELDSGVCFSKWVYDNVDSDDLVEISTVLGTNSGRTYRQLSSAMTILYGLPQFADRVRAGEFTRAHVDVAAQQCQNVAFEFLPRIDAFLATKKADVTCDSLRRSLTKMITLLVPPNDATETATKRRRIDVEGYKDGSACLTVSGPSAEIFSCYNRVQAMALAIHGKNKSAFNLPAGVELNDDRSVSQLEYDLFVRPVPELSVKVIAVDPVTGIQTAKEAPMLGADGELIPGLDTEDGLADYAKNVAAQSPDAKNVAAQSPDTDIATADDEAAIAPPDDEAASDGASPRNDNAAADDAARSQSAGSAFAPDPEDGGEADHGPVEYSIRLRMPTSQSWLANQAATVVTVPFLTLTGDSDLPGTFADGSPVPAEAARTIAGRSKTIQRILTDPATGTPVDAKATTYTVPKDLRKTLIEQWTVCTVPGCSRRAEKSEMDHVDPFFHLAPLKGGLTRFGNLHPLCKKHHALKTAGRYGVTMPKSGVIDYEFRNGISTTVSAPEQPINVAQVLEFAALAHVGLEWWTLPSSMVPTVPTVLELMPGESTIRERDEKKRLREECEAKQRRLSEAFEAKRVARQQLRLEQCLDWENSAFQPCLPAGADSSATKQLTGNRKYAKAVKWCRLWGLDIEDIDFDPHSPSDTESSADTTARDQHTTEPEGSGTDDPWDCRYEPKVNWDHDLETDPPPF